jgi:hypothetical protein
MGVCFIINSYDWKCKKAALLGQPHIPGSDLNSKMFQQYSLPNIQLVMK